MDINLILEIIAAALGIAGVWLAKKENILTYPIGIISTTIYVYILLMGKLYAVSCINLYYTIISIYGWYAWTHKSSDNKPLEISKLSGKHQTIYIITATVLYLLLIGFIRLFKHSDTGYIMSGVMYVDTFTFSLFLIAMFLQARKKLECWIYWIIADFICIPFYIWQHLYFTAIQYLVFTIIAVFAFFEWQGKYNKSIGKL